MQTESKISYEDAYGRLEDLVEQLSAGGLSLEESLRCFEQGMALANYCSNLLDSAELRVQQVNNLPPEELAALLERPAPAAVEPEPPATAPPPPRREEAPAPSTTSRRAEPTPIRAQPPAGPPSARPPVPQSGNRPPTTDRRVPPTSGPQRRTTPEDLDPLFDEI